MLVASSAAIVVTWTAEQRIVVHHLCRVERLASVARISAVARSVVLNDLAVAKFALLSTPSEASGRVLSDKEIRVRHLWDS